MLPRLRRLRVWLGLGGYVKLAVWIAHVYMYDLHELMG